MTNESYPKTLMMRPPIGCTTEIYNGRSVLMSGAAILIRDVMPLVRRGWIFLRISDRELAERWEREDSESRARAHAEALVEQARIAERLRTETTIAAKRERAELEAQGLLAKAASASAPVPGSEESVGSTAEGKE